MMTFSLKPSLGTNIYRHMDINIDRDLDMDTNDIYMEDLGMEDMNI